jgi:hypothetical protein
MNRFEQQAEQTRRAALRTSLMLWSVGGILLVGALALLGVSGGAPQRFWTGAGIAIAVMLLILRQASRRLRSGGSRTVKPDEQSMLHLDQLPESRSGNSSNTNS